MHGLAKLHPAPLTGQVCVSQLRPSSSVTAGLLQRQHEPRGHGGRCREALSPTDSRDTKRYLCLPGARAALCSPRSHGWQLGQRAGTLPGPSAKEETLGVTLLSNQRSLVGRALHGAWAPCCSPRGSEHTEAPLGASVSPSLPRGQHCCLPFLPSRLPSKQATRRTWLSDRITKGKCWQLPFFLLLCRWPLLGEGRLGQDLGAVLTSQYLVYGQPLPPPLRLLVSGTASRVG